MLTSSSVLALLAIATFPNPAVSVAQPVLECSPNEGNPPVVAGVFVREESADAGDLARLRVETASGAFLYVYFDRFSEREARAWAPCLGTQINLLMAELGDERIAPEWDSVVFTSDPGYIPPRGERVTTRWVIFTHDDPSEGRDIESMVLATIPHEQVHDFQNRNGGWEPRWFAEGHATWTGLRITQIIAPERAEQERAERLAEFTSMAEANLPGWGYPQIRREAFLRQVSPADRARMEADPGYIPTGGSYTFTMDDFVTDEGNIPARYAASLRVFETLEARHGAERVQTWAAEVTSGSGEVTNEMLAQSLEEWFGEDLASLLEADPAD